MDYFFRELSFAKLEKNKTKTETKTNELSNGIYKCCTCREAHQPDGNSSK